MLLHLPLVHRGVAVRGGAFEALLLDRARGNDFFAYLRTRGTGAVAGEFVVGDVRDFDVQIDAVEQRAGDFREVALDLNVRAAARFLRIAIVAARTWIHRGDEHDVGGKDASGGGARDGDLAIFERLAQSFLHLRVEFGELV